LAHPEPIVSVEVPPLSSASLYLKPGNYKISISAKSDGNWVPAMETGSMVGNEETVLRIGPTG
jgi:hypothetical protein